MHTSLPQYPSRSLIMDAPGNLSPNPQVNVPASSSSFFPAQSRIRHPVWFIWRREISVDSASLRERTLTMPRRKLRVWGRVGGGLVEEASVGQERTAFTHSQNCENVPLTPSAAQPGSGCVSGDKTPACCSRVGVRRARYPEVLARQRVNSYPAVTPDPDCYRTTQTSVLGNVKRKKEDKTAVYATKETVYLGYALPVQMKRHLPAIFLHRKRVWNWT